MSRLLLCFTLATLAPGGCRMRTADPDEITVTGTANKVEVGVNCWRFSGEDGKGYELRPDQAPADVLVDGKRQTLVLKLRADLMSSCQVGQLVDVVRVTS